MKGKSKSLDMTTGEPIRQLVFFAIPMLIGGVFQLMYNMVDTIVVGRYVSIDSLAAVGATSSTIAFVMMLGNSASNAVSVIIAQAEGAKKEDLLKKAVTHAVYLTSVTGLLLGLISFFGAKPFMQLLQTPDNIIDQSVTYIQITCGLTIAVMFYNSASGILRSIGDSKTPLYFLIFCSVMNVILDLLFVLAFNGGVAGVAWATVVSQAMSSVLCIIYMLKRHPRLCPDKASWRFDASLMREYMNIGLPMIVQNFTLCIGMFVVTAVINSHGSDIVAAYTIGGKVENLAVVAFSNFAFSFSVFSGQNFGAKKYARIKEGVKKGSVIIIVLALISSVLVITFATPISKIFMDSSSENAEYVLEAAVSMVRIEGVLYAVLGVLWMLSSTLRGMGAVKICLLSSIMELICKIGLSILLPSFIGYVGIWFATPIGWILGIIPSIAYMIYWFKDPEKHAAKMQIIKE